MSTKLRGKVRDGVLPLEGDLDRDYAGEERREEGIVGVVYLTTRFSVTTLPERFG